MEDRYKSTYERFGAPERKAVQDFYTKGREVVENDYAEAVFDPKKNSEAPELNVEQTSESISDKDFQDMFIYTFFTSGPTDFAELVNLYRVELDGKCPTDKALKEIIVTGLELGIQQDNAACATELGALYYAGQIVSQDYKAAKDLYELAMSLGSVQGATNLGYIYEYGRTAEPNYINAYRCYSFAATLGDAPEALYKMGDIFSRGKAFGRDIRAAFQLWTKSFEVAKNLGDIENQAQAAIRLAPYYLESDKADEVNIESDEFCALRLYQIAEAGIRLSIKGGLTYYEKRLQQAIQGQEAARCQLDSPKMKFFMQ